MGSDEGFDYIPVTGDTFDLGMMRILCSSLELSPLDTYLQMQCVRREGRTRIQIHYKRRLIDVSQCWWCLAEGEATSSTGTG